MTIIAHSGHWLKDFRRDDQKDVFFLKNVNVPDQEVFITDLLNYCHFIPINNP